MMRFSMIRLRRRISCLTFLCLGFSSLSVLSAEEPPSDWIDLATGHRVIRLSREPGTSSLYFHQNAYTAAGDKLVVTTPQGISTIDLSTHEIATVVEGRAANVV